MSGFFLLKLSNGQRTALIDLISEHLRCPKENQTEEFDASGEKVKARDLLRVIDGAAWQDGE
jgi:hypothetical protein